MNDTRTLRNHLVKLLESSDAHLNFDRIVDFPPRFYGRKPEGLPHTPWLLLEHMRICQRDMLEFCRNPRHISPEFPGGYWPSTDSPPSGEDWEKSVCRFRQDRDAMAELVADPGTELMAPIPHGQGQTVLREVLLLADHNSYHLGQLVYLRRLFESWNEEWQMPDPGGGDVELEIE